jgi:hypothetical protein
MIYGRVDDSYIGIRARYALEFTPFEMSNKEGDQDDMLKRGSVGTILTDDYDLVQVGPGDHYYVTEMSSTDIETFDQFVSRMIANELSYDKTKHSITYQSILYLDEETTTLTANMDGSFRVNEVLLDLEYPRFWSPYVLNAIERKPETIMFSFGGHALVLNYEQKTRISS